MGKKHITEFELSGMSGICREYVGNVGKEEQINKKGLHLTSILAQAE
jgi:hypothetical protein